MAVSKEIKTGRATFDVLVFWKKKFLTTVHLQEMRKRSDSDTWQQEFATRINFIPYEAMLIQSSKQAMVKLKQNLRNTALYARDG